MEEPIRRSWFSRNKTWAIPVGCVLLVIGACLSGGALVCAGTVIKGKELLQSGLQAQTEAFQKAQQSPEVQSALGTPITTVAGTTQPQYSIRNGDEDLKMQLKIQGPNGTATYEVHAVRASGEEAWSFPHLLVTPDEGGDPIDLSEP